MVVNVIATSYSGSTWANLILGSHSQAFSVGEMDRLRKWNRVFCRMHGEDCPVWNNFQLHGGDNPFLQLHRLTGKRVFVVNNPKLYLPDEDHPQIDVRNVLLIRDGRAILASALRKYNHIGITVWKATRGWKKALKKKQRLIRRYPPGTSLCVHYERLQDHTEDVTREICEFLGLPFESAMCRFWDHTHCFISGNIGPLLHVAQAQGMQIPPLPEGIFGDRVLPTVDLKPYQEQDPANYRDERWKTELSDRQLRLFGLLAGRFNRSLGYPSSLDRRGYSEYTG
jgi:hypothetical protein